VTSAASAVASAAPAPSVTSAAPAVAATTPFVFAADDRRVALPIVIMNHLEQVFAEFT